MCKVQWPREDSYMNFRYFKFEIVTVLICISEQNGHPLHVSMYLHISYGAMPCNENTKQSSCFTSYVLVCRLTNDLHFINEP